MSLATTTLLRAAFVALLWLSPVPVSRAQDTAAPAAATLKPLPTDAVARFKALFTNATLSGRWAALREGVLGEERSGDKYNIVSVTQGANDAWTITAKLKYGEQEFNIPIPARVKFEGDTAILMVDNLMIPGGGTYSARLLIVDRTYSGSWTGGRGGGMLYGTIASGTP